MSLQALEHNPEKWESVFRKDHAQINGLPDQANFGLSLEHFPAKWNPVSRKKMPLIIKLRVFCSQNRYPLLRNTRYRYQPLRYTQTRAGGRFIQIRSEASVDTPGSDFGIGGTTE